MQNAANLIFILCKDKVQYRYIYINIYIIRLYFLQKFLEKGVG